MNDSGEPLNLYQAHISDVVNKLLRQWGQVVRNPATRRVMVKIVEQSLTDSLNLSRKRDNFPPGVNDDHAALNLCLLRTAERTLLEYDFSERTLECLLGVLIRDQLVNKKARKEKERAFSGTYGLAQPSFLMINPTPPGHKTQEESTVSGLDWLTFDRVIAEAKNLWGAYLVLITGDDPLVYCSSGKNILDLAEKHPDVFFVISVDANSAGNETCCRIKNLGNLSPVLQIPSSTDLHDCIPVMQRFHKMSIPFGVLLTATRDNAETLLAEPVVNAIFKDQHALYGLVSPCALNGVPVQLNDIPTPQQRLWLWRRSQEFIRKEGALLIDFWNYSTLTGGCLAGGGCGYGGYFYIDWKGDVSPCVLMPYAAANLKQIYAKGESLNDIWSLPLFARIREWQQTQCKDNLLTSCLFWDHNVRLNQILEDIPVDWMDEGFAALLRSPFYRARLDEYARIFSSLVGPIWKEYYQRGHKLLFELPDINGMLPGRGK